MESCLIVTGLVLTATVVGVLVWVLRPTPAAIEPAPQPRRNRNRFEFCPACDASLFPNDHRCPGCGLDLDTPAAARLERIRIARREVNLLREDGLLDAETADRVAREFDTRREELRRPAGAPVAKPQAGQTHRAEPPPLPPRLPEPEPVPSHPEIVVSATPQAVGRRSLAEHLGRFMHERNILWGELAGGLLIVGCSIALVLSLWRTLEALPYFTFLLSAAITGAVFGAGYYTFHHWRLAATSRGLLVIALLLTPLNLLLLADPGARGTADALDTMVKLAAGVAFAALVRTAGRDVVGTDVLPGRVPRRWLLALAVVGAPAALMLPVPAAWLPAWLPLACYLGAVTVALRPATRSAGASRLTADAATAVLLFVGLGLFALFAAWGLFLARADDLPTALRRLAVPTVLAGLPVLMAGLLVHRRLTDPAGLRATGTGAAVAGLIVLFASLVLAWPEPGTLLVTAAAVAVVLGWVAYRDELPWLYAGAIPPAAFACVVLFAGINPDGDPGVWLVRQITSAGSGAVLTAFALLQVVGSELFVRMKRMADAIAFAVGAAGVAAVALLIVTGHGVEEPVLASVTHLAVAGGFLAASVRWRLRVVAQVGVWLVLVASLWTLWAVIPREMGRWGLAISLEALGLAVLSVVLGRWPALVRLRDAAGDVAAAAAILAPVLALFAAGFPHGANLTGTLFAVAVTALVLAGRHRQEALTWVGSLVGCVAVGHLLAFPLGLEPGRAAAVLALLVHATLATVAALVLGRAEHRQVPDVDIIGHLTVLRSPLRYSAQLTSALAAPLLLVPLPGLAGPWAGLAAWTGLLWLLHAVAWRERSAFPAFQLALTWAAGLAAFACVEQQPWFADSRFGGIDPRALQAFGVAGALLSLGWVVARRVVRSDFWDVWRPAVDRVVLGGLVVAQFLLAAGGLVPGVIVELTPLGFRPAFVPTEAAAHLWGPGAWLVLGLLVVCVGLVLRWPDDRHLADAAALGLALLAFTVPLLAAGAFGSELATASALRWGLALTFLLGSGVLALREPVGRLAARLGFPATLSPWAPIAVRVLLVLGGAVVLLLTFQVAGLGLVGRVPTGPAAESVFRRIGWTASVMILVAGLAWTALRERSAGYASAAGWVWVLALAGGYALGMVARGKELGPTEQMLIALLAVGAAAVWALAWLAVEWRIPGRGVLTAHVIAPFAGLAVLAVIPLLTVIASPDSPVGPVADAFGRAGWLMLMLTAAAGYWHAWRVRPELRFHAIGFSAVVGGVLAGCGDPWVPLHTLALAWALTGGLVATLLFWPPGPTRLPSPARRLWPELLAGGLVILGLRAAWDDPYKPPVPAGIVLAAALLVGTVGFAARSRVREYISGFLVALAALLVAIQWGPVTGSGVALTLAVALALAGAVWSLIGVGRSDWQGPFRNYTLDDDALGLPGPLPDPLPPFPHLATMLALGLVLFGLIPTWWGYTIDSPLLAWGSVFAVAGSLGVLLGWDRQARFAAGALYTLGAAAVALAVAGVQPGPIWLHWATPLALAGYVLAAAALALRFGLRPWFVVGQGLVGVLVIGMAVRTTVREPDLLRLVGPAAVCLLVAAAALLARIATAPLAATLRPATLALGAVAIGILAWALPDPAGVVPWLHRHAGLFVALTLTAAVYLEGRRFGSWALDLRRVGAAIGALVLGVLVIVLLQQIPQFNPATRRTPLDPVAVAGVLVGILGLIILAIRLALRPDRDPLGPTPTGRTGYVYLAELLLVLLFAHVRLNVPEVFTGKAVRYWTFVVMLLAFLGTGLAELFARRGLRVLSRPLLRTGVLLPLIPLLIFWAKPPAVLFEFADTRAPGLVPLLGYLRNLPQHFDTYALLWFLAGLLYGLIALSRRSFGWALLGALATNAGLWALLTEHQVPAAVHPQAWAIPLALIVLVSEHVNRRRLRAPVASGLRYLGISMIYVASAADLFIAGVGQSVWLPIVLAVLCLAGVVAGVLMRVRAFLYLGIGFLFVDVFSMIWHAAVDRAQTWVWYASGIVLGAMILALFAVLEKRRNDVRDLVGRLREWD